MCDFSSVDSDHNLVLDGKYGYDGSTGQSCYKQKPTLSENDSNEPCMIKENGLFVVAFVPLKLRVIETNVVLWNNEKPSSILSCRPVKLEFAKETKELNVETVNKLKSELDNIVPNTISDKNLKCTYNKVILLR